MTIRGSLGKPPRLPRIDAQKMAPGPVGDLGGKWGEGLFWPKNGTGSRGDLGGEGPNGLTEALARSNHGPLRSHHPRLPRAVASAPGGNLGNGKPRGPYRAL